MSRREDSHETPLDPQMPQHELRKDSPEGKTLKDQMAGTTDQHHGESTKAPQEGRNIGQHNGAGRPPLMKK